ncbi:MAG: hypothetical protein WD267_03230 [Balneolales bacterium]
MYSIKSFSFTASLIITLLLTANGYSQTHTHNGNNEQHVHSSETSHTHNSVDYSFRTDSGQYEPPKQGENGYYWWKGNLHTHTLWSDGDQFPEVVAQWYYKHGYHFLALSDHNTLMRGKKWVNLKTNRHAEAAGRMNIYDVYKERFGDDWVETREVDGDFEIRLKPLNEVRSLFEQAGRFLMIESQEISKRHTVHINVTNSHEPIDALVGETVEETIRSNFDAIAKIREDSGEEILPHLNHPNFRHAVTAEDMMGVGNLTMFEIYNGHRGTLNYGDDEGAIDLDRYWDIILTKRLAELDLDLVYGVAVDDAHSYENSTNYNSRPGRGWVQVRTKYLTPEYVVRALENGNFYSTTGVRVKDIQFDGSTYSLEVDPEDGIEYTIQFIGTREGYNPSSKSYIDDEGQMRDDRTRIYSDDIGVILQESTGPEASYEFEGDEIYIRAKIISSKVKENYFYEGEVETAWIQPVQQGMAMQP